MKAIQIKYLAPTNHKGSRLKMWAEGVKPLVVSYDYSNNIDIQARKLAQQYASNQGWGFIHGFGCLAKGNYVATLGE